MQVVTAGVQGRQLLLVMSSDVHLHHQDGWPAQIMAVQGGWLQLLMSSDVHLLQHRTRTVDQHTATAVVEQ